MLLNDLVDRAVAGGGRHRGAGERRRSTKTMIAAVQAAAGSRLRHRARRLHLRHRRGRPAAVRALRQGGRPEHAGRANGARSRRRSRPGPSWWPRKSRRRKSFEEARGLGYQLFQGYYFCRPTTFSGGALSARRLAYARLLAALNKTNVSVNSIEDLIKHDASLTYRVLRCINSAAFGIRREIQSIRQALVLLGLDQVRKWASVWALAGLNGGASSELVTIAILRARSCELVAAESHRRRRCVGVLPARPVLAARGDARSADGNGGRRAAAVGQRARARCSASRTTRAASSTR